MPLPFEYIENCDHCGKVEINTANANMFLLITPDGHCDTHFDCPKCKQRVFDRVPIPNLPMSYVPKMKSLSVPVIKLPARHPMPEEFPEFEVEDIKWIVENADELVVKIYQTSAPPTPPPPKRPRLMW